MASAVSTDSGGIPTINSIYDSFSQTKYSYNVIVIAESIVAGVFCRNTHHAIKLVTCR